MGKAGFAIAVLPFLKTSGRIGIGGYVFRSTEDIAGLTAEQEKAIGEISRMLFVQDDRRVKSASYAILPDLEVHSPDTRLRHLANLREVISYFYAAPHDVFENILLSPEETSLVLFTPSRVSTFLARPEHHTEAVAPPPGPAPDSFHDVPGYNGLYNFRHSFWVEPGSRLYGPKPHMTLNISQDLYADLEHWATGWPDYRLLLGLLEKADTPASFRIYSALRWFNAANESGADSSRALLNLAIAFETLLRLPAFSKTERLVDAISLLLGRTERLDDWAGQFYAARSRVAHEGYAGDQYFYIRGIEKKRDADIFGSLMLFGRQVFRLCVGTLLVGIDLAERADLREKFISNNERYQKIGDLLRSKIGNPSERLLGLTAIIQALERYRFVANVNEKGTQLAAAQLSSATLASCNQKLPEDLANAIATCAASKREDVELRRLAAIEALNSAFEKAEASTLTTEAQTVRDLINLIWMNLFQHYYWLKNQSGS